MNGYWLSTAALLIAFCAILIMRLRASHFGWSEATGLAIVALAQPAYIRQDALRATLFALAAYAVTASAQAFIERQDPKRIVFFGSSLAGAQLAGPIWGIVASFALPLAVRRSLPNFEPARLAGLYISLFFIPALMALTLAGLVVAGHLEIPLWFGRARPRILESASHLLSIAILTVPLLLAAKSRAGKTPNFVTIAVCAIMAGSSIGVELFGFESAAFRLQYGAAVAALVIVIVSGWSVDCGRLRFAALAVSASPVFCWILRAIDLRVPHG